MAGINTLGKSKLGKPGRVVHAPDLNRNRTLDFFSEETGKLESDRDYQRTVQDIEDAAQTQGWLFSRGAFDKTDLLYLRDAEEKSRHTEMELHDSEVMAYARLRIQNDKRKPTTSLLGSVSKKADRSGRNSGKPVAGKPVITISKATGGASSATASAQRRSIAAPRQQPQAPNPPPPQQQQQKQAVSPVQAEAPVEGLGDLLGGYGSDSGGSCGVSDDEAGAGAEGSRPPENSSEREGTG